MHNFLGPILTSASVHLDVNIPNFLTQEYTLNDESEKYNFIESNLKRNKGYILLPEEPGLGVSINKDMIKKVPYEPLDLNKQVPYRDDGSIGLCQSGYVEKMTNTYATVLGDREERYPHD